MRDKQQKNTVPEEKLRQELEAEELDTVAGGAQVDIRNTVKDNKHDVKIGAAVIINM